MSPKEIQALRRSLKLDQKELAHHLGVHPLTISQWETGFRSASPLALAALKLLKNFHQRHIPKSSIEKFLLHRFHFLNSKYFNPPLKEKYDILTNTRFKRTHGQCHPRMRKIKISEKLLQTGDWEKLDETLKHEMLHAWLYEQDKPFGHTQQFKELLYLLQKNHSISSSSNLISQHP
jgi:transcriptional regulator with XRE-family HTH domain